MNIHISNTSADFIHLYVCPHIQETLNLMSIHPSINLFSGTYQQLTHSGRRLVRIVQKSLSPSMLARSSHSHMRYMISLVCSGSTPWFPASWTCLETTYILGMSSNLHIMWTPFIIFLTFLSTAWINILMSYLDILQLHFIENTFNNVKVKESGIGEEPGCELPTLAFVDYCWLHHQLHHGRPSLNLFSFVTFVRI